MSDELANLRRTNREGTAAAIVNHLAAAEKSEADGEDSEAKWHRGEAAKLQLRGQPATIPLIDWPPFWAEESTASFLVDPLLPKGRQVVLYAPAKAGKSELALWTAAKAATGQDLFGNSIEPVTVLYLDLEMTEDDVKERLDDFGYGPHTDLSQLCYSQHPGIPPLDTARGGEALESEITALGAELVIIDTLSKVVEGEENAADTYLAFARHRQPAPSPRGCWPVPRPHRQRRVQRSPRLIGEKRPRRRRVQTDPTRPGHRLPRPHPPPYWLARTAHPPPHRRRACHPLDRHRTTSRAGRDSPPRHPPCRTRSPCRYR